MNDINYQLFRIQAEEEFRQLYEKNSNEFRVGLETGIQFLYDYIKGRGAAIAKDLEELKKKGQEK